MHDRDRLKILSDIEEAADKLRSSIIILTLSLIGYLATISMTLFELFRLGVSDTKTILWFLLSLVFFFMMRYNRPNEADLHRYTSLVKEYKKHKN